MRTSKHVRVLYEFSGGMVKNGVYASKPRNLDDLKHRMTHAIARIAAQMAQRTLQTTMDGLHKCIESNGCQI
ncbi:hypothetical protein Trydic_g14794 [Trypoxylus dichotomus]